MRFIDLAKNENANGGTYVLTVCLVFLALFISPLIAEAISIKFLHSHFIDLAANGNKNMFFLFILLPFSTALLALVLSIKHFHHRPVRSLFTIREQFDWKRFLLMFLIWGGMLGISLTAAMKSGTAIEFNYQPESFFNLLVISLFFITLQTAAEEAFFRGFIFQGLGKVIGKGVITILITGTVFGLLHGSNPEVDKLGNVILGYYIITGIFLGILTHMDDGLELAMGYHTANNLFAAVILTNDWQAFQTDALFIDHSEPIFGVESLITLFIFQPLLLLVFSKIYKWKDWKAKMIG